MRFIVGGFVGLTCDYLLAFLFLFSDLNRWLLGCIIITLFCIGIVMMARGYIKEQQLTQPSFDSEASN